MKQFVLHLCLFLLCAQSFTLNAQQPQQPVTPTKEQEEVVRISTNLVQVDAVVTDKNGQPVTDLQADDFQILEDGRAQDITNFSYVRNLNPTTPPPVASETNKNKLPPPPPVRLRPEQVRRTIALVVDDLSLSFESTAFVRQALRKYVDEQMQPTDLVAILRTGAGMGATQLFTSNKPQLYAAIERVRWNARGTGGISAFASLAVDRMTDPRASRGGAAADDRENTLTAGESIDEFREDLFAVGTLGAINYVVRGLRELPGRKSVVLFSDGIAMFRTGGRDSSRIVEALRRLTDLANRASVVIYTIDARGLPVLGLTAADNVSTTNPQDLAASLSNRRAAYYDSQSGLDYLAQQTGGFFAHETNDLAGSVKHILRDQEGYYLIGYRPEASTFDAQGRRRFHRISVLLKKPGLRVRSRTGFYGVTDEEAKPVRHTRGEQLSAAITSPFSAGDISVRLTSLFANDAHAGSFVRSLLFIDASKLTFIPEADGWHKTVLDVVAVTFGDNGQVIDQVDQVQNIKVRGQTLEAVRRDGLIYNLNVPIKRAGAYQLRMAVRDSATERTGSANQFIEVPDISKNKLALSGLVVLGLDPAKKERAATPPVGADSSATANQQADPQAYAQTDPQAKASVRRFRVPKVIEYNFSIYNAQLDKTTHRPQLQSQMRIFRDGQVIYTSQPMPIALDGKETDFKRITVGGKFQLGEKLMPGEYILQVIITDQLAKEKYRTKTQWSDFEIVTGDG